MRPTGYWRTVIVAAALLGSAAAGHAADARPGAATAGAGALARDFTVVDRATGRPVRLTDFAGKIVVLDFFAHWCVSCRSASADLERQIRQYYAARGGNPAGWPVVVVAINIDPGNERRTAAFVSAAGIALATDDARQEAFGQFDEHNVLPLVVVVNGAAGAPGCAQWQVLYRRAGYEGAPALRKVIDAVGAPGAVK